MQPMLPPLAPKPKVKAVAPPKIPIAGIINYNVEKRIMQNTVWCFISAVSKFGSFINPIYWQIFILAVS